jgi:hypothetical protein
MLQSTPIFFRLSAIIPAQATLERLFIGQRKFILKKGVAAVCKAAVEAIVELVTAVGACVCASSYPTAPAAATATIPPPIARNFRLLTFGSLVGSLLKIYRISYSLEDEFKRLILSI